MAKKKHDPAEEAPKTEAQADPDGPKAVAEMAASELAAKTEEPAKEEAVPPATEPTPEEPPATAAEGEAEQPPPPPSPEATIGVAPHKSGTNATMPVGDRAMTEVECLVTRSPVVVGPYSLSFEEGKKVLVPTKLIPHLARCGLIPAPPPPPPVKKSRRKPASPPSE